MFISIILFFASLVSLSVFITLLILNIYGASFILSMLSSMMSFLIGEILFYKNTNKYPLNDIMEYSQINLKKLLNKSNDCLVIRFEKKEGFWICKNEHHMIKLDLTGYLFQKSYLISFVIRNLRYPLISNKLPYKYLFQNEFFIKENLKVKLELIDGDRKFEKMVVENGLSRYGFIAQKVTISPFYLSTLSNRHYQSISNFKSFINEKRYKQFYINRKM